MYRDASYLIIKDLEKKQLRIIIKGPMSKTKQQKIAVAFVDNADFFTSGKNCKIKIE